MHLELWRPGDGPWFGVTCGSGGGSCFAADDRAGLASGMFLLCDGDGRTYVFDVFEHENGILLGVFEFLEQEQGLLIVTQAAFYSVS